MQWKRDSASSPTGLSGSDTVRLLALPQSQHDHESKRWESIQEVEAAVTVPLKGTGRRTSGTAAESGRVCGVRGHLSFSANSVFKLKHSPCFPITPRACSIDVCSVPSSRIRGPPSPYLQAEIADRPLPRGRHARQQRAAPRLPRPALSPVVTPFILLPLLH